MFILTSLTAPFAARTTFSSTGVSCLQGPHQGAQKSTSTGWRARFLDHVAGEGLGGGVLDEVVAGAIALTGSSDELVAHGPSNSAIGRHLHLPTQDPACRAPPQESYILVDCCRSSRATIIGSWPVALMKARRSAAEMVVVAVLTSG
jgi:hypothetical protein